MKLPRKTTARRVLALALAALMVLSTATAVSYTAILSALAAEEDVNTYAPAGTMLVSKDAKVTISACTNERAGSENSYEMPSEGWSKSFLTDGLFGRGGWSCQPYDREKDHTKPVTITLELLTKSKVSAVTLFPNGSFPAKYEIQVSSDGKTFTKVAEDGGVPVGQTQPKTYTFAKTDATYVRLCIIERNPAQGADGALAQLGEIAVFGSATVALSLPRTSLELFVNETDQITSDFLGTKDTYPVTYKSADPSVVAVAADGTVTAKKLGKTTVTVTCAALNQSVDCEIEVVTSKHSFDENIMLSIFWPPTPDYITDEQYKLLADAGINWVMGAGEETLATVDNQKKMLELCAKYGIGMTVSDGHFGGALLNKSEAQIAAAVSRYKNVPGAYGFYILDEPLNPNAYINAYVRLKKAAPDAYMHLNFLPSGAYGSEEIYEAQMNDWCRLTAAVGYPLDYLMFDRYPFPLQSGAMDRAGFFANVRSCYEVGLKNQVKTGLYIQTVCQEVAFRRPTANEIRYEMYASLAFGYKQLSFFTWFTPVNRSEPFKDGIIAADGTPNAHYETVKTINHEILAIGQTLVKCDALEVWFNGPDTYGQPSVPADFFVQADQKDSVILSFLRHRETGRNYLMVVNNNYFVKQEVELTFDKAITALSEVSRTDGSLKSLTMDGQKLVLTLAAGDAMLIALPEGYDYAKPASGQPDASVNLAADACITCPTSPGSDGWYMACLNDGVRLYNGTGMGWRTEESRSTTLKDAYIDIDLGRTLSFNRVDLYPAGTLFDFGTSFPKSLKISVSEDGESFTEVKSLTDLTVTQTAGMKVDLGGEQTARYIRVELTERQKKARYAAIGEIEVYLDDGSLPAPETFSLFSEDGKVITYKEGENIAFGKDTVVSSATNDVIYKQWGWSQDYINDGKYDNGWTSNVGLNRSPDASEFVCIDLGDVFAVDTIRIFDFGVFPENYEVALSEDGCNWTVVHTEKGAADKETGDMVELKLDTPVNARVVRVMGTKLRGGGVDGYLLQLGEIEVYGTPVCDKTLLQQAIDTFRTEGGDETAREYTDAVAALDNALLTRTQEKDYAKKLLALLGLELETDPPETETTEPDTVEESEPTSDTSVESTESTVEDTEETTVVTMDDETEPSVSKGCTSALASMTLSGILTGFAAAWILRKRRED